VATRQLSDLYPGSAHVQRCGLGSTDDAAIWEYAKSNGFTIVSKDSDFEERSILSGSPPKLIRVRAGNCTREDIESVLRAAFSSVNDSFRKMKKRSSFWDPGMAISRGVAHRAAR
jgi:predicted nuclease of predicted toxin-antitoxin system